MLNQAININHQMHTKKRTPKAKIIILEQVSSFTNIIFDHIHSAQVLIITTKLDQCTKEQQKGSTTQTFVVAIVKTQFRKYL